MAKEGMIESREKDEIVKLIVHHSFLHKGLETTRLLDSFGGEIDFCIRLVELSRCDNLGRFCEDTVDDAKYREILEALHSRRQMEIFRISETGHSMNDSECILDTFRNG